ncbi:hypothetical protein DY000_02056018 [Brassica cretica]|uniref:Uncharacterized protein n=1 Tax=Brassica cretica TaxID=69181 RepID=A0ABQ7A485_BRACR|nr:hypothetical protein DY000_02056018 [Brassica cretica]
MGLMVISPVSESLLLFPRPPEPPPSPLPLDLLGVVVLATPHPFMVEDLLTIPRLIKKHVRVAAHRVWLLIPVASSHRLALGVHS